MRALGRCPFHRRAYRNEQRMLKRCGQVCLQSERNSSETTVLGDRRAEVRYHEFQQEVALPGNNIQEQPGAHG